MIKVIFVIIMFVFYFHNFFSLILLVIIFVVYFTRRNVTITSLLILYNYTNNINSLTFGTESLTNFCIFKYLLINLNRAFKSIYQINVIILFRSQSSFIFLLYYITSRCCISFVNTLKMEIGACTSWEPRIWRGS